MRVAGSENSLKKKALSDIIIAIMKAKYLRNLSYLTAFFLTLLPLTWSSYRLKTISWPDIFVFAIILAEIYFYVRGLKKKGFVRKDILLLFPFVSLVLIAFSFVWVFIGFQDMMFHDKTSLFFNLATYSFLAGSVSFFAWKQIGPVKQENKQNRNTIKLPVVFFLLACVVSFVNAVDLERSIFMFKSILTGVIIFFFLKERFDGDKNFVRGLGYCYVLGASVTAILGLVQALTGAPMGFIGNPGVHNFIGVNNEIYGRIASTMQHPNLLAAALLPAVFINLSLWVSKEKKKMWLNVVHSVSLVVLLLAVILTYSRAAWLGLFLGFAGFTVVFAWGRKKVLFGIIAAALLLLALFHGQISDRIKGTTGKDVTVVSRIEAWKSALAMFKDHPFTGVGLNNFYVNYEKYKTPAAPFMMEHAHNTFLNTAAELGLFGLFAFLWILLVFFKKIFSPGKEVKILLFGLMAVLIAGCFENLWFDPRIVVVFWILLALISSCQSKPRPSGRG